MDRTEFLIYLILGAIVVGTILFAKVLCDIDRREEQVHKEQEALQQKELQELQWKQIVESTSELLKSVVNLQNQYRFHNTVKSQYVREKTFHSKGSYDRYNCDELFDTVVFTEYEKLSDIAKKVQENKDMYQKYLLQVCLLQSTITEEITTQFQIPFETYREIEDKLYKQYRETFLPVLGSRIICIAHYISPKGQKDYSKQTSHSVFEVEQRYQEIIKIIARKNSIEEQRRRERAKMSDSLRYDILRRDGFRCQICGRTQADGIKLHVDHIVPISKGGRTVKSNLRTLCDQCNLGKRDKIE